MSKVTKREMKPLVVMKDQETRSVVMDLKQALEDEERWPST